MRSVIVDGAMHRLDPSAVVGQGGEAVVFRFGKDQVVKIYLSPDDPTYAQDPLAQQGARLRLDEQQHKLPAFPTALPAHVVAPLSLAYDQQGRVAGYTMPFMDGMEVLLSYADRDWREKSGVDVNQAVQAFRNLHQLVGAVHAAGVVIGDFNDLNVLVAPSGEVFLVDADSMQFGPFLCRAFKARFLDPLHSQATKLILDKPHSPTSDWYAFATMLFQALLYVHPFYGGVHLPKSGRRYRLDSRILHRISVFSPDVRLPKAAVPLQALPDDLLSYFTSVFEQDKRGEFPLSLFDNLRWTACLSCGNMHARHICPTCATPGAVKQTVTVHGDVTATTLFSTPGRILFATSQGGELRYVYHESDAYWREGGVRVTKGSLDSSLRVRIWGDKTVVAKGTALVALNAGGLQSRHETQMVGQLPIFDANNKHLYWIDGGRLVRNAPLGQADIGLVLSNRTLIWVGSHFGFGFFRAGTLTRGFVFDVQRPGINDAVPLPPMRGNLIDAASVFSKHTAWFFVVIQEGGVIKHHCYVISDTAQLLAHAEAVQGDGTWLGESIRGHMADGSRLFVATDAGIARIGIDGGSLVVESEYPSTEAFVSADAQLLPAQGGIVVVTARKIVKLTIR